MKGTIIKMNVQNAIAAKILGEILASGMSISDTNFTEIINSSAANGLESIRNVTNNSNLSDKQKLEEIKGIIKNIGIY